LLGLGLQSVNPLNAQSFLKVCCLTWNYKHPPSSSLGSHVLIPSNLSFPSSIKIIS
jgi:hypothetical protein